MARNLVSGNGMNGRNNGNPVEEPLVNVNEAAVNVGHATEGAAPGVGTAAAITAMLQGI